MKKRIILELRKLVRDTLMKKVNGRREYSTTKLIMGNAWFIAMYMVFYDLYKEGFRYDVFLTLCSIALGVKLNDALSQRIKKES